MVVVAAFGVVASSVFISAPAHATEGFVRGSASADAGTFGLAASLGGANAGINWGASQTSYREGYATAAAKPLDLGLLRLLLGEPSQCPGVTDPVPLMDASLPKNYETNTMQATAGTVVQGESDFPGFYGAPSPGKVGTGSALATAVPYATASTTTPTIDLAVFKIVNPSTRTESSLQNEVRFATATSKAERIEFLGGMLTIENPTWTATVRSGAVSTHEGGFSVTGGSLFGEARTPEEAMGDLKGAAQWVEWLLGYVGLGLDLPEVTISGDLVSVSPLKIHLTNSPLAKDIIAPLFLSPVEEGGPTFEEIVTQELDKWAAQSCDNKRFRQLAPILIDLIKGTGVVGLPMGGVTAQTDDTPSPDYDDIVPFEPPPVERFDDSTYDPGVLGSSVPYDNSYAGYAGSYDELAPLEPEATTETTPPSDEPEVIEFAAGGVSRSRTVLGETGGPVVWIAGMLAVLGVAGFLSERAWRARQLRRTAS